jgi:quercetin dioxygenase-like cupin family protein
MIISESLTAETYDVFEVKQVTRGTSLESLVAVDMVRVAPYQESESHRHNKADTVLLIMEGQGIVRVAGQDFAVKAGDRIHISPRAFHQVITQQSPIGFISVQTPPILSKEDDVLDLETEKAVA